MKRRISFLAAFALCSILSAKEITVSVGAGKNWKQKMPAQFAVWLEDEEGNYVHTLYVTKKTAKKSFIFSPKEGRPESLPVWYHASKNGGENFSAVAGDIDGEKSGGTKNDFDAVSSATPKGGVIFTAGLEDGKDFVIKAEFNTSFDYNDFYTKKNSGVNGQPSVIYSAKIPSDFSESSGEIILTFAGTGSLDGSDGNIQDESENLTTAKSIVKLVAVKAGK